MKKALLIVDIQNDFLPGGSLGVKGADQIIPLINKLIDLPFDTILASMDAHPSQHGSFAQTHGKEVGEKILLSGLDQILWPVHCVQNTKGAEFSKDLKSDQFDKVFLKGTDKLVDSYSAFFDNAHKRSTGLDAYLNKHLIKDVFIAGIATDYCVKYSVLDALQLNFNTYLIKDACKAVNLKPNDEENAVFEMVQAGANILETRSVSECLKQSTMS